MPDTPSITIVKRFTYRGLPEEFSNTYHFSGTVPTSHATWKTLADAIANIEKPTVPAAVAFSKAYGYVAGSDDSVAQIDWLVAPDAPGDVGTYTGGGNLMPGDVAATIRWWTGASFKGKKIYCRKYLHGVLSATTDADSLVTAQKTAMTTFAGKLIDGTLPGGVKYCGPQGAVLSAPLVNPYLTTRTLKRRGKRPPTSP